MPLGAAGVGGRGGRALGPLLRLARPAAPGRGVAPHVRRRRRAARAAARALRGRRQQGHCLAGYAWLLHYIYSSFTHFSIKQNWHFFKQLSSVIRTAILIRID